MYNLDLAKPAATRAVDVATATAVTVVDPVPCRMRAVVCRSISERAVVEYTGTETDDRQAVIDAILPQIPDDAWQRNTSNSWAYIESLECIDGDEMAADAGMRSRLMTRGMAPAEKLAVLRQIAELLASAADLAASIDKLTGNNLLSLVPAVRDVADEAVATYEFLAGEGDDGDVLDEDMQAGRATGNSIETRSAQELEQMLAAIDELIALAQEAAATADPGALADAYAQADADLEALREKLAAVPPAADPAADA